MKDELRMADSNGFQPEACSLKPEASLRTLHGNLPLPAFFPDATRGCIRAMDAVDAEGAGVTGLMVNILHLSTHLGMGGIERMGGIHRFMGWDKPVASDSGGFQAFSLVAGNRKMGSINADGFVYRLDKSRDKKLLTPEKCIRRQLQLGSDILFCLDYCTHPDMDGATQRQSVDYTVAWGERCKAEFVQRMERVEPEQRPLLYAVVQGGASMDLRRECAERLLDIGFDGYGFGGWPVDDSGALVDTVAYVAELIPARYPKHALGLGKPENIVRGARMGYATFDCVLPTRDARHKRLYVRREGADLLANDSYEFVYMQDERHAASDAPIDATCDCATCRRYSRAYLHHLFCLEESGAWRLATIHNVRFFTRLMEALRQGGVGRVGRMKDEG